MTKIYDIISLNNHLYMIDKEATTEVDTWGVFQAFGEPKVKKAFATSNSGLYKKILASTDTTLGLPLLPKVEEDEFQIYLKFRDEFDNHLSYLISDKVMDFKKAEGRTEEEQNRFRYEDFCRRGLDKMFSSAKKYDEVDLLKAVAMARECYENNLNKRVYTNKQILQSLAPKPPIAVEVEMEYFEAMTDTSSSGFGRRAMTEIPSSYKPKIKNNIVIIKKWIYDKSTKD